MANSDLYFPTMTPRIFCLFAPRCPAAILGEISEIGVDSIQRESFGTRTHVAQESFEGRVPFGAHLYTFFVVILAALIVYSAPSTHRLPTEILSRLGQVVGGVLSSTQASRPVPLKTSTTARLLWMGRLQARSPDAFGSSATAHAVIESLPSHNQRLSDGESAYHGPSQIKEVHETNTNNSVKGCQ